MTTHSAKRGPINCPLRKTFSCAEWPGMLQRKTCNGCRYERMDLDHCGRCASRSIRHCLVRNAAQTRCEGRDLKSRAREWLQPDLTAGGGGAGDAAQAAGAPSEGRPRAALASRGPSQPVKAAPPSAWVTEKIAWGATCPSSRSEDAGRPRRAVIPAPARSAGKTVRNAARSRTGNAGGWPAIGAQIWGAGNSGSLGPVKTAILTPQAGRQPSAC